MHRKGLKPILLGLDRVAAGQEVLEAVASIRSSDGCTGKTSTLMDGDHFTLGSRAEDSSRASPSNTAEPTCPFGPIHRRLLAQAPQAFAPPSRGRRNSTRRRLGAIAGEATPGGSDALLAEERQF